MSCPKVHLEPLIEADLLRCTEIFGLAFADDAVNRIVRPEWLFQPSYTDAKRLRLGAHMLKVAHFDNPEEVCMKAVERDEGGEDRIWGMAIWSRPGAAIRAPTMEELVYLQGEERDEETDVEALHRFTTELAKTRIALLGETAHWYLMFVVVDPVMQGKGVGRALIKWGLDQADSASPPLPVMLESSVPGKPIYPRYGFDTVGSCQLEKKDQEGKVVGKHFWPQMLRKAKTIA